MNSTDEPSAKKSINELKIAELRKELEQRGVDHKGLKLKQNLIEALENALKEEGNDPAEFLFTVSDKTASSKKKPGVNLTKSEKEDSKPDQSTTLDSSGLVESAEATTTTTEPSDDKSTDEVHEENSSAEAPTKHTEGEVNSSKADDSSNMEALQLTEPDDLYDEYREASELAAEVKKADEKAHAETGGSSSSKKKSSSSSSTPAKKHSSSSSSNNNNNSSSNTTNTNTSTTTTIATATTKARGKRKEDEKANGPAKSAAASTTGDQGDSTFDAEEAHIGHSDGNSVEVKARSKDVEKQKGASSKNSTDDKDKSKKKDAPPAKEKDSAKSESSKKDTKDSGKEKPDGKASSSSASKTKTSGKSSDANGAANNEGRNVWVSGITSSTRASDLQAICKKYGKVVGVKIIANSKQPGSKCYGVVTMDSKDEAEVAVKNLNKTELNGKTITVEKVMPPEAATLLKQSREATSKEKDRVKEKDSSTRSKRDDVREKNREKKRSRERSPVRRRARSRSPIGRNVPSRGPPRGPPARPFAPPPPPRRPNPAELRRIEAERVAMRRERIMRDAERRRIEDERRTRDEIEREKEKLRLERERLERERAELLRLEREKARIERERIEREKEELKRRLQQPHPDDLRRGSSSLSSVTSLKRPYDSRDTSVYYDTVKRSMLTESSITAPPPMSSYASDARYSMTHYGTSSLVRAPASDARYSDYSDVRRDVPRERDDRKTPVSSNTSSGVSASSSYYRPDPSRSLATGRTGPSARGDDSWRRDPSSTGPGVRPTSGGVNPLMPVTSPVSTIYSSMPLTSGVMQHPPLGSSSGHQLTSHPSDRFVTAPMRRF